MQGRSYNRLNREVDRRREVTEGFAVALRRGNARGAKEPCCLQSLRPQGRQGRDDKRVHRFAGPEAEKYVKAKAENSWKFRGLYVQCASPEPTGLRLSAVE